jgi:hypothetical protein
LNTRAEIHQHWNSGISFFDQHFSYENCDSRAWWISAQIPVKVGINI